MRCRECGFVKTNDTRAEDCSVCGADMGWQRVMLACGDVKDARSTPSGENGFEFREEAENRFQAAWGAYRESRLNRRKT